MKGQTLYGELESAKLFVEKLTVKQVGMPTFVKQGKQTSTDCQVAQAAFSRARLLVASGDYDLVVLDELNCAVDFNLVALEDVKEMLRTKPEHTELVLPGRNVHPDIVELADLVTEMREIMHYHNSGQAARVGIES